MDRRAAQDVADVLEQALGDPSSDDPHLAIAHTQYEEFSHPREGDDQGDSDQRDQTKRNQPRHEGPW